MTYTFEPWDWDSHTDLIEKLLRMIHEVNKEEFEFNFVNKLILMERTKVVVYLIKRITGETIGFFSFADITKDREAAKGIKHCAVPDFAIDAPYQKVGLGLKIMRLIEEFLTGVKGFNKIEGLSKVSNTNANRMYEHMGYKPYLVYWVKDFD